MSEENVKVAVRVRPFNKRERQRNAVCIVEMNPPKTLLNDPENMSAKPRAFQYDFSYWSFDGCKERNDGFYEADLGHANGKKFCDQVMVYKDLGVGVLNNAWEGYNSTLFAYGQTGSGKSWSIVGYGINRGVVPQFCEEIFSRIDEKKKSNDGVTYEVSFSMLEIYNEEVRDLLSTSKSKSALNVRQHPKKGFYADKLTEILVVSYKDIEARMAEGTSNRTVAATKMNATSSRAHTIVGINLVQKSKNSAGEEMAKTALINLVDLAGSERAGNTGATGDRLKEGAAINQSLSALGNVISALAEQSEGKSVRVPYRNSVLTKLLKNALGGNSKTIMIAAISPADINYAETLSTLRYADRAKQIKVKAKVNEDPTAKLIRELQEENEKLKKMLGGEPGALSEDDDGEDLSPEEREEMRKEMEEDYGRALEENKRKMEEMQKSYEERLKNTAAISGGREETLTKAKTTPHFSNLNPDPLLNGYVIHLLEKEKLILGKDPDCDILIPGPSIMGKHAELWLEKDVWWVQKVDPNARIVSNGDVLQAKDDIYHNDRLVFGTTQFFIFVNPSERDASKAKYPLVTYETAQEEIAKKAGISMISSENCSSEDAILSNELLEVMPGVESANAMSEDMDKRKVFEMLVVPPELRGEMSGRKKVFINVTDLETGMEWVLNSSDFLNRKLVMENVYSKFEEEKDIKLKKNEDPFYFDEDDEVPVGTAIVVLQSLSYRIETTDQYDIIDYSGNEIGKLAVELKPCSVDGKEYTEKDDMFVESPEKLIGQNFNFIFKVSSALGLPDNYNKIYFKYNQFTDPTFKTSKKVDGSKANFNYSEKISVNKVDEEFLSYLKTGAILVQLWAKQSKKAGKGRFKNTRQEMRKRRGAMGNMAIKGGKRKRDQKGRIAKQHLKTMEKVNALTGKRLTWVKESIKICEKNDKDRIAWKHLKALIESSDEKHATKCLKMIAKDKEGKGGSGSDSCVIS